MALKEHIKPLELHQGGGRNMTRTSKFNIRPQERLIKLYRTAIDFQAVHNKSLYSTSMSQPWVIIARIGQSLPNSAMISQKNPNT